MAAASPVPSQDNTDDERPQKEKSPNKVKKQEEEVIETESEPADRGEDEAADDDAPEGEYEIEQILDARKGQFGKGKLGYYVKWVGYGESENSWVTEDDASNAKDLIDIFWAERNAKKASKRARKSTGEDDNGSDNDASASVSAVKKRARKSGVVPKDEEDADDRPVKKARKSAAADKKKAGRGGAYRASAQEDEEEEVGDMSEHMHVPTWDHLIKQIDTVERVDDKLFVYFTLKEGERIRESSDICADKFPKTLLRFYEANLRWKEAE